MPASKDEFAAIQGEYQQRGSPRVMALGRSAESVASPAEAPKVDIDDRQVVSFFDTRPIGAYDFVVSGGAAEGNLASLTDPFFPAPPVGNLASNMMGIIFPIPVGFVAVVRRIEFTIIPPHSATTLNEAMRVAFQRNGSAIPNNNLRLFGVTGEYAWDTHQIFGYWEQPSLVFTTNDGNQHVVGARILGTLIPAKNASPVREVGSLPVAIRGGPGDK